MCQMTHQVPKPLCRNAMAVSVIRGGPVDREAFDVGQDGHDACSVRVGQSCPILRSAEARAEASSPPCAWTKVAKAMSFWILVYTATKPSVSKPYGSSISSVPLV